MSRWITAAIAGVGGIALVAFAGMAALQPPRLPVPERADFVIRGVVPIEAGRAPGPPSRLRIEAGAIAAIEPIDAAPAADAQAFPAATIEIDELAGLYVTPGLSDLHVHYPPAVAVGQPELWSLLLLAHGVTSIRETGSIDGRIFEVREAIEAGRLPGPRIFACGEMLDGRPPSFPSNRQLTTPAAGRRAVVELAHRGADCIKVYNMLSPEVLAAIRDAARAAGLPLIGHVPHAVPFEEAGVVDLQHGTGAVLVDRERVGRLDFRWADWATMDEARIAHVARVAREQDIAVTPTLVNARMRLLLADPAQAESFLRADSGLRHLPRFWPGVWGALWGAPFEAGDADDEAEHASFRARQAAMTVGLHRAGVRVHAGTDALMPFVAPGSSLHGELAELVSAGIPPADAWAIATRGAGRELGLPGQGTLAVGAPADLLFLRSDPSRDLGALTEIEAVMVDGRLYTRAELDAMLASFDAHFHGAFYAGVMDTVVSVVRDGFAPEQSSSHDHGGTP